MPNRILKESICASENIDQLSVYAEVTFYRLMVNCDDYGRMDARTKILKSRLFPLKDYSDEQIISFLTELSEANLIEIYHVNGKPYLQMKTWERHQQIRNHKSKYPSPDDVGSQQLKSSDINCNQLISDDSKCPRNPIQSESISESESLSNSLIDDDEAHKIQSEQNRVLDAAEDAGFRNSDSERAQLIRLYAEHGLEKMLDGLSSCVEHSAPNLAYLKACLSGKAKPKTPGKVLPAQNFTQRDYNGVNDQIMNDLARDMAAFKGTG